MRVALAGLVSMASVTAACGADPALRHADDTVHVALEVAGEAEGTLAAAERSEPQADGLPDARRAFDRFRSRLDQAEQTVSIWFESGTGKMSWYAVSPCLAGTLRALGAAFEHASLRVPENLDQAAVMATGDGSTGCAGSGSSEP